MVISFLGLSALFFHFLYHQKQVQGVQQLTLQLELLVVVDCVQNVGSDLEQVRNYLRICVLLWRFINLSQQVVVPLVGLFLERVVLVDFVGL